MAQQPYWAGSKPIDETTLAVPGAAPARPPTANIPSGSPLDPLRTTPLTRAPVAAAGDARAAPTDVYLTRPPAPKAPPVAQALMTTQEKIDNGLDPALPYRWDETLKPDLPEGTLPEKDAKKTPDQRAAAEGVLTATGLDLEKGIDPVIPLIEESTSGGLQKWAAGKVGALTGEATSGMEKIGRLQTIANDLTLQMTGGSLGAQISNTDRDYMAKRMGDIGNPDIPANQRLAAWDQVKRRLAAVVGVPYKSAAEEDAGAAAPTEAAPGATPPAEPDAPPSLSMSIDPTGKIVLKDLTGPATTGGDTGIIGEEGGTHTETDPRFAGANKAIAGMVRRGKTAEEIVDYMKGKGFAADQIGFVKSKLVEIRQWEEDNNTKWNGAVSIENIDVPNTALQSFQQSDVGAGLTGYTDAALGFSIDNMAGLLGKDPAEVRAALDASREAHPLSTLAGNIAGGATAATGATAALGKAGVKAIPAIVGGDVGYGTVAGGMATDVNPETGAPATLAERGLGALKGATAAAVGSGVGLGITGAARTLGAPAGNAPARVLNEEGIPTTVGAQYGGKVKKFEDWFRGQPGGGVVSDRQIEAIERVNTRVFDKVLKPLGITAEGKLGPEAVEFAQDKIQKQYAKALDGKEVSTDRDFAMDFAKAFTKASDLVEVGPVVSKHIDNIVTPRLQGGKMTGEGMQEVSRELRDLKANYIGTPRGYKVGQAIDDVEEAVFGMFRRQEKDVVPEYNKAQVAYKRLAIASDAVLAAEQQGGVFMPRQIRAADRNAAKRSGGKISAAGDTGKGQRQFGELSAAAQDRLPSKLPDSGTARFVIPTLLLTSGGATTIGGEAVESEGLSNIGKAATLAAILSMAYTKGGQRMLTKPGRGITNKRAARIVGEAGKRAQAPGAHLGTAEAVALQQQRLEREERERKKKKAGRR